MDKRRILLAALAAGGERVAFSPVQVQKLLFLIDREASELVGGPHFDFKPYNYGPFDRTVYDELETLSHDELVKEITEPQSSGRFRKYTLTPQGYERGSEELNRLPPKAISFVTRAAEWVLALTFRQLVATIYDRYPDMKKNSVFLG